MYRGVGAGRSLSGEIIGTFSQIFLRQDTINTVGLPASEIANIIGLFVLVASVEKMLLDASSDHPASQKVVSDFVNSTVQL